MTIQEVIEKFDSLEIEQERVVTEEYAEFVISNDDIEQWDLLFSTLLGPAVKPAGSGPSKEDSAVTKDFGGIFKNQTLFKKAFGQDTMIAMFWPWGNQVQTTLKIAVISA